MDFGALVACRSQTGNCWFSLSMSAVSAKFYLWSQIYVCERRRQELATARNRSRWHARPKRCSRSRSKSDVAWTPNLPSLVVERRRLVTHLVFQRMQRESRSVWTSVMGKYLPNTTCGQGVYRFYRCVAHAENNNGAGSLGSGSTFASIPHFIKAPKECIYLSRNFLHEALIHIGLNTTTAIDSRRLLLTKVMPLLGKKWKIVWIAWRNLYFWMSNNGTVNRCFRRWFFKMKKTSNVVRSGFKRERLNLKSVSLIRFTSCWF